MDDSPNSPNFPPAKLSHYTVCSVNSINNLTCALYACICSECYYLYPYYMIPLKGNVPLTCYLISSSSSLMDCSWKTASMWVHSGNSTSIDKSVLKTTQHLSPKNTSIQLFICLEVFELAFFSWKHFYKQYYSLSLHSQEALNKNIYLHMQMDINHVFTSLNCKDDIFTYFLLLFYRWFYVNVL